jgi:hypothetical protein
MTVNEVHILECNIERFRHLLQSDLELDTRSRVKQLLDEFEAKLSSAKARSTGGGSVVQSEI